MIVFTHEIVMTDSRIVRHEVGERLHGRGRDVVLGQQREPVIARLRAEALLQERHERRGVVVAEHPRREPRILRELVESQRPAQLAPERLIAAGEEEPLVVARLVEPVRGARPEARRLARVLDRVAGLKRQRAVQQGRLDALAAAGALPHEEAGEHRLSGERRRVVVGDRDAQILRRSSEALQRHHPGHRLEEWIEARPIDVRTCRSERGDRAVHEPRIDRGQPRVPETEAIGDAGPHVLEEHVGARDELFDDREPLGRLEVQGDRSLATVPRVEAGQLAKRFALERLDLDDRRAEVGEHHAGVRAGDVAGAVDDPNALERCHAATRSRDQLPMVVRVAVLDLERFRPLEVEVQVVLPREADATVHLDRLAAHLARGVADVRFRHRRRQLRILGLRVERPRRVVHGGVRVLHLEQHLRALVTDGLEGADRLSELLAHLRVLHGHVETAARRAEHLRGGADRAHAQQRFEQRLALTGAPSTASAGTSTPSNVRFTHRVARSMPVIGVCAMPPARGSTRKSVSPSGVRAGTSITSAMCAHATNGFDPESFQPLPDFWRES